MFQGFREKDDGPRKTQSEVLSSTYDIPIKVFLLTDHSHLEEAYTNFVLKDAARYPYPVTLGHHL